MKGGKENGCVDGNGREYDFVSRYFAPWNGINEDPVTGEQTRYTNTYPVPDVIKRFGQMCNRF